VVIETRRHALVYDAGPSFRSGSDAGQLVVVPFLHARGIRSLDRLVVSHDDDDHKGGAASVADALRADALVLGPGVPPWPGSPADDGCRRGEGWTWDGVQFRWLHPGAAGHARDNDNSCVLLVQAGPHAVLLSGVIEAAAERELVRANLVPQVDVVVAPHHGSRTSSTAEFVARARPRWVVYSVGHRNRWNFPSPRVVERWRAVGAADLLTSRGGAIRFELEPGRPLRLPVEWRRENPRPWLDP
jgi:competence protein ComEC